MSRRSFRGATVLVSGAAGGLGRAIASRFADDGSGVALLDRDATGLEAVRAEIEARGARCTTHVVDVADAHACERAVGDVLRVHGGLDLLVNNAGISHRSAFDATAPAVLRRVMEVNFFGAVNLTRASLPALRRSHGTIVTISSVAGFAPLIARTGYAASKHALHGFFDSLRIELAPDGVSVMLVCPSFVATGIDRNALGADGRPATHAQVVVGTPLAPGTVAERIWNGARRGRRLLLVGRTARLAWWLDRFAPAVYARMMAARLRGELGSSPPV